MKKKKGRWQKTFERKDMRHGGKGRKVLSTLL